MFGDLEGMPMLLPLNEAGPAADKSNAHVLDVLQQVCRLSCALSSSIPSLC
jgi:hypothetical protein